MDRNRAKELINCLLAQVSEHIEWDSKETYLAWLTLEVGFTKEELAELDSEGYLPMPLVSEKSDER